MEIMGELSEAVVCKLDNTTCFKANTWVSGDGTLEAFWYEDGNRITHFFKANGEQIGSWKRYKLKR